MKKIVTLLFLLPLLSFSQEEYAEYNLLGNTYKVEIENRLSSQNYKKVYFNLNEKGSHALVFNTNAERLEFVNFLRDCYEVFEEWKDISIRKRIGPMLKEIYTKHTGNALRFYKGSKEHLSLKPQELKAIYFTSKENRYYLLIEVPKAISTTDKKTKSKIQTMMIESEAELNSIISTLDDDMINTFLKETKKKE